MDKDRYQTVQKLVACLGKQMERSFPAISFKICARNGYWIARVYKWSYGWAGHRCHWSRVPKKGFWLSSRYKKANGKTQLNSGAIKTNDGDACKIWHQVSPRDSKFCWCYLQFVGTIEEKGWGNEDTRIIFSSKWSNINTVDVKKVFGTTRRFQEIFSFENAIQFLWKFRCCISNYWPITPRTWRVRELGWYCQSSNSNSWVIRLFWARRPHISRCRFSYQWC